VAAKSQAKKRVDDTFAEALPDIAAPSINQCEQS